MLIASLIAIVEPGNIDQEYKPSCYQYNYTLLHEKGSKEFTYSIEGSIQTNKQTGLTSLHSFKE